MFAFFLYRPLQINKQGVADISCVSRHKNKWGCVKIGAASLFCNILKTIKQSPDFHKPGLCHVKKFLYLYDK